MEIIRIGELLSPFISRNSLAVHQLEQLAQYLDLLRRWNVRTNLTAIRDEEGIVVRHFGESLFAARHLFADRVPADALDLGSGAGFPGIPLKIYAPDVELTLIESQNKKATFLKEVIRALGLTAITVHNGRAEQFGGRVELVTLRAVESFEHVLPVAASLLRTDRNSSLALLIGEAQVSRAQQLLPSLDWADAVPSPGSTARVLLIGHQHTA